MNSYIFIIITLSFSPSAHSAERAVAREAAMLGDARKS